jgi:Tfp pilus assembly protein PilV
VRSIDPDNRSFRARLRARHAAACAAARSRLRSERGSALIEVMVGAVVLSLATVALLNGVDGAQNASARSKARSTAAALAEQDQERMRAMPVTSLAGYSQTRTVAVKGVNYTVVSASTWATDTGGSISCSNNQKTSANLRISSSVSSNGTRGNITQVSLVTPPPGTFATGEGRAIVKLLNSIGAPVANATVNMTGASTATATTNSLGCAVFPFLPVGNYTASVGGLTLVDWQGVTPSTKALTVTQGTSTTAGLEMDSKAEIRAVFDTSVNGAAPVAAKTQWMTLSNSKLTVGAKTFNSSPASPAQTTVIAQNLYPFLDGYGAFAGKCSSNNPALPPTNNTSLLQTYSPTPGQILILTTTNDIRMPSINVRVVKSDGTLVSASPFATVKVTTNDAGCTNTFANQTSNASGAMPSPGHPYGSYKICAERTVTGTPNVTSHGHADVYNGGYDPLNNGTGAPAPEVTSGAGANKVDDTVFNTTAAGNTTTTNANGAIQIKLNRTGACP